MFMNCPRCEIKIEKGWNYCPRCGYRPGTGIFGQAFDEIFPRFMKQMEETNKQLEKEFEAFDLSPFFRIKPRELKTGKPVRKGFSVRIFQRNRERPKVFVRTFGNVNRERIQREIQEQLGQRIKAGPTRPEKRRARILFPSLRKPKEPEPEYKIKLKMPHVTEEPKTEVRRLDSKVVVDIDLPDVESMAMVDVKELENSVEVKAVSDGKAYFKILTKPAQFKLTSKDFKKGKLHLEFA
jgi:hypothetical protein